MLPDDYTQGIHDKYVEIDVKDLPEGAFKKEHLALKHANYLGLLSGCDYFEAILPQQV